MAGTLTAGAILTLRDEMSAKLDRARATSKRFVDQIHAGASHVDKFTSSIVNSGAKMVQNFGSKASAMLDSFFGKLKMGAMIGSAAIGALAFKGAEASMDFEAQIRHATGLLVANGASSDQADQAYTQFANGILAMAPRLAKAPDELAKSLYLPLSVMAQYGEVNLSTADTLKVVEAASKAATAGFADSTTVTTALSRVLGAYGASADEATHYTDIMQQAVNYGLMTFSDMSAGIGKVAGPAAALKIPFEQVAAAIATITRRGILPDEAFTALNKVMLAFEKPHPEAIAGLEAMFGPQWKDHVSATALATKGLSGVMDDLMGHVKPTAEQMAALNQATDFGSEADVQAAAGDILGSRVDQLISVIGDVRGLRGLLALTSDSGGTSFAAALGLTENATGAVQKQFDEYRKTTQYAKDEFMSFIAVLEESVLGGILPSVGDVFHHMNDSLSELTANPVFQDASVGDKLKMIGTMILDGLQGVPEAAGGIAADLWDSIVGWWDDHHSEVEKKVHDFFTWLGDTAIPWVLELGGKLAGVLGPAILQGLWAAISSPEGLAIIGGGAALKFGGSSIMKALQNQFPGAAGGVSGDAAAGELSAAATQLQAAASALMEAAGAEGTAAGELGAGGAAGALKTGAGSFFAGGLVANVASVTIAAASVYMAAKTIMNEKEKGDVRAADLGNQLKTDLAKGDFTAATNVVGAANQQKGNQSWAADFSAAVGSLISPGLGNPDDVAKTAVFNYITDTLKQSVAKGDMGAVNALGEKLRASGMWDQLGTTLTDQLTGVFANSRDAIRDSHAKEELQSMVTAGFDLTPLVGADEAKRIMSAPYDVQKQIIDEWATKSGDVGKFADGVDNFVKVAADPAHLQDMKTQGETFKFLADQIRAANPQAAAAWDTLAGFLFTLANWTPPPWFNQSPTNATANAYNTSGGVGSQGVEGPGTLPSNAPRTPPATRGSDQPLLRGGPQAHGSVGTAWGPTSFTAGEAGRRRLRLRTARQGWAWGTHGWWGACGEWTPHCSSHHPRRGRRRQGRIAARLRAGAARGQR
jgi:TP901 family phage tail tape measure protein